jgi:ribosomal protein S18 acetylase RimI-like enzyme
MLAGIEQFTSAEQAVALELVDIALNQPQQTDYCFLIAEEQRRLIGYICFGPTPMTEGTFDLYWVASAADARTAGVGTRLVQGMEKELVGRGGRLIRVETSSQEHYGKTLAFYEKHRYLETARIPDFYKPGDDLITLTKRLG